MVKEILTIWNGTLVNKRGSGRCVDHASEDLSKAFFIQMLQSTDHRPSTRYPPPNFSTPTHTHTHSHFHTPSHLVLEMSTRGEFRGNAVHRGSLSWYARLVILQSQFLITRAPVRHLPVHSVCPKLWLPPPSVFYNDILASRGALILTQQLACTHMAKPFALPSRSSACSSTLHHPHRGMLPAVPLWIV